jgi:deoxycytidylate deaminase
MLDDTLIQLHRKNHPEDVRKAWIMAIITKRNKIISVGYNRRRFHWDGKFTFHAEEVAIKKAGRRANGATIHVLRIMKNDDIFYVLPCHECAIKIKKAGCILK